MSKGGIKEHIIYVDVGILSADFHNPGFIRKGSLVFQVSPTWSKILISGIAHFRSTKNIMTMKIDFHEKQNLLAIGYLIFDQYLANNF